MSLQVWLPLVGNLDNFGLSNCSVSAGPITYSSDGKIGSAATFSADNNYIMLPGFASQMQTYKHYSLCAWIYLTSKSTDHSVAIISSGKWNYNNQHIVFGLSGYTNNAYSSILIPVETGGWATNIGLSAPIHLNTWYHICITFDGDKTTAYLNGELQGTNASGGISHDTQYCKDVFIGHAGTSYYDKFTVHGKLNDVRIYDHCLSSKEVKEISKALVLHYPMNDNIQQMDNCYGSILITRNTWGRTGHQGSASLVNQNQFFSTKTQSYKVSNGSTATENYLVYREVQFSGGYRSFQAIIKEENGQPITNAICYPSWNGYTSGQGVVNGKWTSIQGLGNGYYLCKCEGIYQTTSPSNANSHLLGIYVTKGNSIYISEWWVENNKQTCSHFLNTNPPKVIDCGIANIYDGTINGKIAVVKDSPRYSNGYQFNGTDSYITANAGSEIVSILNSNTHTIACWVKTPSSLTSTNLPYFVCRTPSGNSAECQVFLAIKSGAITHSYYSDDWSIPYSLANNTWYHIAFVSNNKQVTCYVNGVNIASTTKGALNISNNGVPTVGADSDRTGRFNGNLSDFRIYSTALSDSDIAELYHSAVIVDNTGKNYAYEYFEA